MARKLEQEFAENWNTFHNNMDKARTILDLYPTKETHRAFESYEKALPSENPILVQLLDIKDAEVLRIFNEYKDTSKTRKIAEAIHKKQFGNPLTPHVALTYWKYADVVRVLRMYEKEMEKNVLLEQAIVAACTAYERFLKDMIPWVLKNHRLAAKKYLGRINRPVKELGRFDFDALGNVDEVFLQEYQDKQFPVFPEVVEFYKDILGLDLFWDQKEARYVERIFEVRHCIVHNAGKPDTRWKTRTGGAKYSTDRKHTDKYLFKIHTKLHDSGALIYKLLDLNLKKAPFKMRSEKTPFKWKFGGQPPRGNRVSAKAKGLSDDGAMTTGK